MTVRFASIFSAFAALALTACTAGGPVEETGRAGQAASGSFSLGSTSFALPAGSWTVASEFASTGRDGGQITALLVSRAGRTIDRVAVLRTGGTDSNTCPPQRGGPVHFTTGPDRSGCWSLQTRSLGTFGFEANIVTALRDYASDNGYYLPVAMVGPRYGFSNGGDSSAHAEYLYNVDLMMPKGGNGLWRPSEWSVNAVRGHAAKETLVNGLRNWGSDFRRAVYGGS